MNDRTPDRSRDISQPLSALSPDETLKAESDFLRGSIAQSLVDPLTGAAIPDDTKLMKFHGIYQQDDRDLRDERRRQKLEPAYQFMVRVRLPGGVCTPRQWLQLDELARAYGQNSLRLTTRQTFQFHGIVKRDLQKTIQGINAALLDTKAACGDDSRGVMCSVNPHLSSVHAEVYALARQTSDEMIPRMRGYHEIWLGEERVASSGDEEPFYGRTYLPRKFKIGFVTPPINDIDIYTQDLGFIAIVENGGVTGYNICVGGGMGRTDNAPDTYPRLADVIGFVRKDKVLDVARATAGIQRDYGDRVDRAHARLKYTIDDKGLAWFSAELEHRIEEKLGDVRPYEFVANSDDYGWRTGGKRRSHYTFFIENGRIRNWDAYPLMDGLREIAKRHTGEFRLTPNQNLIIANVLPETRQDIEALLREYTIDRANNDKMLRRNSIACVALPTCGLAMAESERYLPTLVSKLQALLDSNGLGNEPITIRMSGCPNGCSRPYVAEIGLTGRAPGKYNLYLGGGFHGQRLNKLYLENVGEKDIVGSLSPMFASYARERKGGERFGDFVIRKGHVKEVRHGREFND